MKSKETMKKYEGMKKTELVSELKHLRTDYTLLSLKVRAGKEDNISQVNKIRKDIARLKTVINSQVLEK